MRKRKKEMKEENEKRQRKEKERELERRNKIKQNKEKQRETRKRKKREEREKENEREGVCVCVCEREREREKERKREREREKERKREKEKERKRERERKGDIKGKEKGKIFTLRHLFQVDFLALFLLINLVIYIWRFAVFYYTKNYDGTVPNIMYMISRANGNKALKGKEMLLRIKKDFMLKVFTHSLKDTTIYKGTQTKLQRIQLKMYCLVDLVWVQKKEFAN